MSASARRPWWQSAVLYEIYIRSFQDSDGDGVGDLRGVLARVDHLAKLGIDAAWLTPFYSSPMADFGYDVADYTGVDPVFGTLADFDALVAAFRERGIRTIIDFVPNHSSHRHPWFLESRSSRVSPKRDWYLWRDPAPDGGPPNNWRSLAGGPAWTFDPGTGQFYLHTFLPEQPDLNWRNPEVRAAMMDVLRFWLARGVDGFRVDVLAGLLKDAEFRDDPPNSRYREGDPDFMRLDPVHSSNQPEVMEIIAGMRDVLAEFPGERVLIGELYNPVETLVAYYGRDGRGVQLPFNFNLMWLRWVPWGIEKLVRTYEAGLPPGAWPTWVLGNHDQPRVATRLRPAQARVAMMLLLTLRGTPTLYQGDELGMTNAAIPPERIRDPFVRAGKGQGRDPERVPIRWDESPGGGFTTGEPWLPLPAPGEPAGVAEQERDPASMLALTRALLALRRREPALALGDWEPVMADEEVLAYDRVLGDRRCRVVLNLTSAPVSRALAPSGARVALSTLARDEVVSHSETLSLGPDEGVVLTFGPPD